MKKNTLKKIVLINILLLLPAIVNAGNDAINVVSKGRSAGSKQLSYKKSKVPSLGPTAKLKNIPKLDIGEEPTLEAADFKVNLPEAKILNLKPISKKIQIADIKYKPDFLKVSKANKVTASSFKANQPPDIKALKEIAEPSLKESNPQLKTVKEFEENDLKFLQALIILEKQKNLDLALGLFSELFNDKTYRNEARFDYALAAKDLGLYSEFKLNMLEIANNSKDKEWSEEAAKALVKNIAKLDISDTKFIEPLASKYDIDDKNEFDYHLYRAKYFLEAGHLGQVEDALSYLPEKSKYSQDALYISSVSNYRQGKLDIALEKMIQFIASTEDNKQHPLRPIGALTLGRMYFQKGKYKEAFDSYLKVDKNSPLWLQAMIEQAWTQVLSQDYEGAAGNMFSLHTDFFKNAFAPESYVIRTVGYLNLCQYGDGLKVLENMQKKYGPWVEALQKYEDKNKKPMNYYETVKKWIKSAEAREIDGLPRTFIVELARHPAFLNPQSQLNNLEEEMEKFNQMALSIVGKEKDFLHKITSTQQNIDKLKKDISEKKKQNLEALTSLVNDEQQKLSTYKILYAIAKRSRTTMKETRQAAFARIDKEKSRLREVAAEALMKRYAQMVKDLNTTMDQNEVLYYELYSGAGEHLRYQMAGGDVNKKDRPELKVENEKSLKWKFKGEIWEDEVGHFRSSLKNVCPPEDKVSQR